jgi:hypothetical protein
MKIAILDDYQNVALKMADWSALAARADITVFDDHLADPEMRVVTPDSETVSAFEAGNIGELEHRLRQAFKMDVKMDSAGRQAGILLRR